MNDEPHSINESFILSQEFRLEFILSENQSKTTPLHDLASFMQGLFLCEVN